MWFHRCWSKWSRGNGFPWATASKTVTLPSGSVARRCSAAAVTAGAQGPAQLVPSLDDELEESREVCGPDGAFNIPAYVAPISIAFNLPGIEELNLDAETVARIHELAGPGRCLVVEDAAHAAELRGVHAVVGDEARDLARLRGVTQVEQVDARGGRPFGRDHQQPPVVGQPANGAGQLLQIAELDPAARDRVSRTLQAILYRPTAARWLVRATPFTPSPSRDWPVWYVHWQ